jgi:hypothetical protein
VNNGLPWLNVSTLSVFETGLLASTVGGSVMIPTYGVYRSTNDGSSWIEADKWLANTRVNTFAVNTAMADTNIFAGTEKGVFLSTDDGMSWGSIGLENVGITALLITPNAAQGGMSIFAGTWSNGVYRSTDRGLSWEAVNAGLSDTLVSALAVAPRSSGSTKVLAGTQGGSVYSFSDDGASWNDASNGLLFGSWDWGAGVMSLTTAGTNVFACTRAGIFLSTNDGDEWVPANDGISSIAVNTLAITTDKVGNTDIFAGTFPSGIFRSSDSGSHWAAVNKGINCTAVNTLTIGGTDIFAGGATGVFLSTDNGASWNLSGLRNVVVVSLFVASNKTFGTRVFAGTQNGSFVSADAGASWDSTGLQYNTTGFASIADETGGMCIFANTWSNGVFRSTDEGSTWKAVNNGLPITSTYGLCSCGTDLFVSTGERVYVSSNMGESWDAVGIFPSANTYTWIPSMIVSLDKSGDTSIFLGTNSEGLLVSTNMGMTWHAANTGFTGTCVYSMAMVGQYLFAGLNMSGVWRRPISELSSVLEKSSCNIPRSYSLGQNYPNPFNPSTAIGYALPATGFVSLKVYNVLGREVGTLVNERQSAGNHSVSFHAANLPSGVYFYRLEAGTYHNSKKLLLLK